MSRRAILRVVKTNYTPSAPWMVRGKSSWARSITNPSTMDDFAARASARLASDSPDLHSPFFPQENAMV